MKEIKVDFGGMEKNLGRGNWTDRSLENIIIADRVSGLIEFFKEEILYTDYFSRVACASCFHNFNSQDRNNRELRKILVITGNIYIRTQWRRSTIVRAKILWNIYIYLERLINPLDRFVSRMATERKNSITRVSNAIFVTVVAARVCPSSFLCPFECVYRIFVTDRASCRIRISGLFKGFPRSRACC